ncbi:putative secreted or membrane protein [Corynebacterium cystitidis]|nr:putative secreted or membrane protein [Corynebacterium cystitidis]
MVRIRLGAGANAARLRPEDWDEMLAPLGLLADAARVLPPQTWQILEFDHPTREMGEPVSIRTEPQPEQEADVLPNVVRPEEPLEMPTRTTGTVRGVMVPHAIGGDEVEAIADGREQTTVNDGTRVAREKKPPSIFDDETQGSGHEQTGHEQTGHEQTGHEQ